MKTTRAIVVIGVNLLMVNWMIAILLFTINYYRLAVVFFAGILLILGVNGYFLMKSAENTKE